MSSRLRHLTTTRRSSSWWPSAWSLRSKLVASVVALFLLVTLATGVLTVLALQRSLTQQLDQDLLHAAERWDGPGHFGGPTPQGGDSPPPGGGNKVLRLIIGNGAAITNYVVTKENHTGTLTRAQVSQLDAAQLGSAPRTIDLGGDIGKYRLVAAHQDNGYTAITGIPTEGVDATLSKLVTFVIVGTSLGLAVVAAGGTYLVRRSLEPLERVAATARRVSRLKLDFGDVALAERIPAKDTDARTEVGQVGLALNDLLDNVDGALRARQESETRVRQFVADASHELRTPLASIRGYAELSRREPAPVPASVTHALSRVESEAQRMSALVEDLLLLARLDAGRPLERQPVDLSLLALDAVSDAHAAAPMHRWELDLPDQPVEVLGDVARLHQVVANLLANARTHTPSGTQVVTAIRQEGEQVRISVHDDGPGVPESLQGNVFQRFTRGDDSRSRSAGSTGLGLSIVDAVAHAHGGRVSLSSKPGDTAFSVLLPAPAAELSRPDRQAPATPAATRLPSSSA